MSTRWIAVALAVASATCCAGAADRARSGPPLLGTGFSAELDVYPIHPTSQSKSVDEIFTATLSATGELPPGYEELRKRIIAMYRSVGIDISLDAGKVHASTLDRMRPRRFSSETPRPLSGEYPQPFSVDACFYHPIPANSPRVLLPEDYVKGSQLHTVHGWDGCGTGVSVAGPDDPIRTVHGNIAGRAQAMEWRIADTALDVLPDNPKADQHMYFVDATTNQCINLWHPHRHDNGRDYVTRFTPGAFELASLGDQGGAVAAGFPSLTFLLRPGEATDPSRSIPHALGGCVNKLWNARVYPAWMVDAWIAGGGAGGQANGLIPYGGILQLDPALDLTRLRLSLPALRILQAIQTYGYYLVDTGGPDVGIFTATDADEYAKFGGVYHGPRGNGVQNQITRVLAENRLYVVPPVVKYHRDIAVRFLPRERPKKTKAKIALPMPKPRRAWRLVDESAPRLWAGKLKDRISAVTSGGAEVRFTCVSMRSALVVCSVGERGELIATTPAGSDLNLSWDRLAPADLANLAAAVVREGESEDHAMAAFFLLLANRPDDADGHFVRARVYEEFVRSSFVLGEGDSR